jgi:hypothetical protein
MLTQNGLFYEIQVLGGKKDENYSYLEVFSQVCNYHGHST